MDRQRVDHQRLQRRRLESVSQFGYYWEDRADGSTFTYTDSGVQYKRKQTNGYYKFGICPACDHDYPYIKTTVGAGGQHWKNSSGF